MKVRLDEIYDDMDPPKFVDTEKLAVKRSLKSKKKSRSTDIKRKRKAKRAIGTY